ncbi:MAG: hypothetical protein ACE5H8_14445, partial [Alphaproteobacteria bacterium]
MPGAERAVNTVNALILIVAFTVVPGLSSPKAQSYLSQPRPAPVGVQLAQAASDDELLLEGDESS